MDKKEKEIKELERLYKKSSENQVKEGLFVVEIPISKIYPLYEEDKYYLEANFPCLDGLIKGNLLYSMDEDYEDEDTSSYPNPLQLGNWVVGFTNLENDSNVCLFSAFASEFVSLKRSIISYVDNPFFVLTTDSDTNQIVLSYIQPIYSHPQVAFALEQEVFRYIPKKLCEELQKSNYTAKVFNLYLSKKEVEELNKFGKVYSNEDVALLRENLVNKIKKYLKEIKGIGIKKVSLIDSYTNETMGFYFKNN